MANDNGGGRYLVRERLPSDRTWFREHLLDWLVIDTSTDTVLNSYSTRAEARFMAVQMNEADDARRKTRWRDD